MTPVINPWVFYAIGISDRIIVISSVIAGINVLFLLFYLLFCFMESEYVNKKFTTRLTIVTVVASVMLVLVPSESTITKMIVAQNVTYERVETVTDTVETVYNDIMELFDDDGKD